MTFAVLRALHAIIGAAIDDIEHVYAAHPTTVPKTPTTASPPSSPLGGPGPTYQPSPPQVQPRADAAYASPPPSPHSPGGGQPAAAVAQHPDFPSLDVPGDPASLSETLTAHPVVVAAINRIVAAAGQLSATVQNPFMTLCDATMGYHLPSCMRILEASHTVEILREGGPTGLHVKLISELNGIDQSKLAHILRLLATHHLLREVAPDVFALNRISAIIETGKLFTEIKEFEEQGCPELKYQGTNGISAFVGLCTDEIHKSSAYLTETCYLSPSKLTREGHEPTRASFCYAFGTVDTHTDYFGWLEGRGHHAVFSSNEDDPVEIGLGSAYAPTLGRSSRINEAITTPVHNHSAHKKLKSLTNAKLLSKMSSLNSNKFRLERFSKAMSGTGCWEGPGAVFHGFDWNGLPQGSRIVDVGGGIGSTSMLLASAFSSAENQGLSLKFIIQDRPSVVEMGEKAWAAKCPALLESGAAVFQVHDFFGRQPVRDAAVFLLRVILHDWPDDFARRILLHLRNAAAPDTKLLVADYVLPLACRDDLDASSGLEDIDGAECMLAPAPLLPNLGKASANVYWMDLTMQVMFNAQERTLREIAALALSAGWKVVKVAKMPGSLFGYITAVPVPIPAKNRVTAGSGSASLLDTASAAAQDKVAVSIQEEDDVERREREKTDRGGLDMIERVSSRCGTPTFNSNMELSTVAEALARFGGGSIRSRGHSLVGRGGHVSSAVSTVCVRPGTLKIGVQAVGKHKRPSPLSFPKPLAAPTSPLPTPIQSLASPRLSSSHSSQPAPVLSSPNRRRLSHAQLMKPQAPPQSPATMLLPTSTSISPRQQPASLARRASQAHLVAPHGEAGPLPPPSLIPSRYAPDSPVAMAGGGGVQRTALTTSRPNLERRASVAYLPVAAKRARARSIAGVGGDYGSGGVGMGIGMGALLSVEGVAGAGKVLQFHQVKYVQGRGDPDAVVCGEGRGTSICVGAGGCCVHE